MSQGEDLELRQAADMLAKTLLPGPNSAREKNKRKCTISGLSMALFQNTKKVFKKVCVWKEDIKNLRTKGAEVREEEEEEEGEEEEEEEEEEEDDDDDDDEKMKKKRNKKIKKKKNE